jgi:hypothetical protein
VASRDDVGAMHNFITEFGVGEFDHIIDEEQLVWSTYGVRTQPAFTFINDSGEVKTIVSRLGEERLTEEIGALL